MRKFLMRMIVVRSPYLGSSNCEALSRKLLIRNLLMRKILMRRLLMRKLLMKKSS